MNCWKILGIEQTFDLAAIKTAYAAKAKEWHPEEHPEEFQQLQQAYRIATRLAKAQRGRGAGNPVVTKIVPGSGQDTVIQEKMPAEKEVAEKETAGTPVIAEKVDNSPVIMDNISEPEQSYDYGGLSQGFDYEAVEEAELKDQFFKDFFSIAWNPYLMNNLLCWECVLKRAPYELLLAKTAFRYNFVRTACCLSGWRRKTLLFFEKWLQSCPAADEHEGQKKATDLLCWKCSKISLWGKIVPTQRSVTTEQKALQNLFLSKVKRYGKNTNLAGEEDMECYLSFYLPYAADQQSKIKELYQKNNDRRLVKSTLLAMALLIAGMVIYVNVSVVPRRNDQIEQQRIQQQADEIRKYNETLQQNQNNSLDWTPEYREELMQKAIEMQEELLKERQAAPIPHKY